VRVSQELEGPTAQTGEGCLDLDPEAIDGGRVDMRALAEVGEATEEGAPLFHELEEGVGLAQLQAGAAQVAIDVGADLQHREVGLALGLGHCGELVEHAARGASQAGKLTDCSMISVISVRPSCHRPRTGCAGLRKCCGC